MLAELTTETVIQMQRAATLLQAARKICILTGAGVSAESGIPTFRDKQTGLWEQFRAEDLASPDAFTRDPKLVWSWYQWRRKSVQDTAPNAAHHALAQWQHNTESEKPQQTEKQQITLITQNVDDLHEQAGSRVTHLHGNLWRNRCNQCNAPYNLQPTNPLSTDSKSDHHQSADPISSKDSANFDDELITCELCGGYIRPDIVWFGESLPVDAWQTAEQAAANCEVFISIGTSSLVYPAAGLAQLAKQNGATIIEINPNPTPSTVVDITLAAPAGIVMPQLVAQIMALESQ